MFTLQVTPDIEIGLRELRHAEELYVLVDKNRSHLRKWMGWVDHNKSVEDSRKNIVGSLQNWIERKTMSTCIRYQGKIVGMLGLNTLDWTNKSTEIGYWLDTDHQGMGIVTTCSRFVTTYAFEELGMNRVTISCATGNVKSRAVPERLGFTHEGTIRDAEWLYDHYVDHEVYGMLARDWNKVNSG